MRVLRHLSQDSVSDYLGLTGDSKRRSMTRYKGDRNPKDKIYIKQQRSGY